MNKLSIRNIWLNLINLLLFIVCICFTLFIWLLINRNKTANGYSFFIEFNNAHGINEGTYVRMRGVNIGYIKNIKIDVNSILVLVHIKSSQIFIPRNSIIEINQTGLLNDTIIDIIPLSKIIINNFQEMNVFSNNCNLLPIICHLDSLEGDRGLNYDDLIRAATRISQRFDDPNFFNIFYLFLQNSLEMSDEIISATTEISYIFTLLNKFIFVFLEKF